MARTAVVSGGGTGIGRAAARRLAANGDHVVLAGRRAGTPDDIAALAGRLASPEPGRVTVQIVQADGGAPAGR